MKVLGLNKVIDALKRSATKHYLNPKCRVRVGFQAPGAWRLHENIEMAGAGKPRPSGIGVYWGPRGQAKFLESAARELDNDGTLAEIVKEALKQRKTLAQALLLGGLRVQREAQKRVPVEYGTLKNSAFTVVEHGG